MADDTHSKYHQDDQGLDRIFSHAQDALGMTIEQAEMYASGFSQGADLASTTYLLRQNGHVMPYKTDKDTAVKKLVLNGMPEEHAAFYAEGFVSAMKIAEQREKALPTTSATTSHLTF